MYRMFPSLWKVLLDSAVIIEFQLFRTTTHDLSFIYKVNQKLISFNENFFFFLAN